MTDLFTPGPGSVFDPTADLPEGTTVLEASAGTGKTYTIAAAATRFIALGQGRIDRTMLVTFARSASLELRSRVHERLQSSMRVLGQAMTGRGPQDVDPVDAQLCTGSADELARRHANLRQALADFDRVVIATTHEFCARLLGELGTLVDHDTTMCFVSDMTAVRSQVIDDAYLARAATGSTSLGHEQARVIGAAALAHPALPLLPGPGCSGDEQERLDFATEVRARMARRRRAMGIYGFADMIERIDEALADPCTGELAAQTLAARFDLVMVDEFQDTDPLQWRILERAFHHRTRLVVIGDPKQSIYGFRGADLQAYLDARSCADQCFTLGRNHRSDACVVDGIAQLFGRSSLGGPGQTICLTPVTSSHEQCRVWLDDAVNAPGVHVRAIAPDQELPAAEARKAVVADLVREFVALLARGRIDDGGTIRNLRAADLAVLVRSRRAGDQVRRALTRAGIPAVFTGGETIFGSEAARAWLCLLDAMCDPRPQLLFELSLTELVGWTPGRLARASDEARNQLLVLVTSLRETMDRTGPTGVLERLCVQQDGGRPGLMARLLSDDRDGERAYTDLRHVTELLEYERRRSGRDLVGLRDWLAGSIRESAERADDDAVRRLETDHCAVSIMTIHRAKGLQFPVVALPDMANKYIGGEAADRLGRSLVHAGGVLSLDLFGDRSPERHRAKIAEEQAEDLRLLYVAATRAQSRLIAWWTRTRHNTSRSALHRLLMNPHDRIELSSSCPVGTDVVASCAGRELVRLTPVPRLAGAPEAPLPPTGSPRLAGRVLTSTIDHSWSRTSYSSLVAGIHGAPGGPIGLDEHGTDDEPQIEGRPAAQADGPGAAGDATPLSELPGGTQFGSLVHSILESVDPAGPDLAERTTAATRRMLTQWPVSGVPAEQLSLGLQAVMDTPLGELTGGASLRHIGAANRLAELSFDLPLGSANGSRELGAIAELWGDRSLVPADDPLVGYGQVLADSGAARTVLRGFLTGSIDAVLRLPSAGVSTEPGQPVASATARYVVIDYKTNRVPTLPHATLGPHAYTPAAMTRAMIEAHYPLQALLYCVGLHRYLGWRLPGYDPVHHLAGVGYLFLRGMSGPEGPADAAMPPGVFTWHPRAELIEAVSGLLAGGHHAEGGAA
ncbi:UvrD-helicase domain-containing protein [Propionibacterium australiense]|uniref:RecBCD enzyme subunit RecB n=1 Tax=Propionibacterium australiense TaxID=119981 RepID=A0A8B3FL84_9ACTN|nr:UvrD-helicase domain-containing protein [Propionibacterium australiense]RLP12208.1 exodeoxyribonuclease V [Propionibacterium australiense]